MTNVLVCVKRVPDPTGEVVLTPDGLRVDGRYAGYTTSAHEEAAVALAVQVAEASGGTVTVLSVGSEDSLEQVRAGIAVGATDGVLVEADADLLGPADVADAVAEAVRARSDAGTTYDLVLLGNDAADTGDFQVGVRLAYLLDRPSSPACRPSPSRETSPPCTPRDRRAPRSTRSPCRRSSPSSRAGCRRSTPASWGGCARRRPRSSG